MKKLGLVLSLLSLAGAVSASAETIVFDNSTANSFNLSSYTIGGPDINNAFLSVDNSFTLATTATINEITAGLWLPTGYSLVSLDGGIYSAPLAGGSQFVVGPLGLFASTLQVTNQNGLDAYTEYFKINPLTLAPGAYYLAFTSVVTKNSGNTLGSEARWDWSANPSTSADQWNTGNTGNNSTGLPSTTFALLGPNPSAVPEPSSLLLLGSGLAGLVGMIRRRVKA